MFSTNWLLVLRRFVYVEFCTRLFFISSWDCDLLSFKVHLIEEPDCKVWFLAECIVVK
jgi:hypothetical protein